MSAVTKPGVYPGMDSDVYHSDPTPGGSLSSSWARKLMEPAGPARFQHERRNPQPPKRVFEFGHAAHALVLGVGSEIARIPEELLSKSGSTGTTAARDFMAEARANGRIPLKDAEANVVDAMAAKLRETPEAMALLAADGTQAELSAFHIDSESGMWLRGRFDAISPSGIVDYKTTTDADPGKFARRTAHELGYHQQDAWYRDLARALDITDQPLRFILQEKTAPYLVSVVQLDDEYVDIGRRRNRAAIELYAKCLATDVWPGFTGVSTVGPPMWLATQDDAALTDEIASELEAYAARLAKESAA